MGEGEGEPQCGGGMRPEDDAVPPHQRLAPDVTSIWGGGRQQATRKGDEEGRTIDPLFEIFME